MNHTWANPWALVVSTGSGDTQDRFLYLPLQNYPEKAFGGRLERVRDWAYLQDATPHQHL